MMDENLSWSSSSSTDTDNDTFTLSLPAQHTLLKTQNHDLEYGARENLFHDMRPTRAGGCHASMPRRRVDAMLRTAVYLQEQSYYSDHRVFSMVMKMLQRCFTWVLELWDRSGVLFSWKRLDGWICDFLAKYYYPSDHSKVEKRQEYVKGDISSNVVSNSSWNLGMGGSTLIKAPEIDPYESWWNGKVSLFEFMRYLVRDYLYSSNVELGLFQNLRLNDQVDGTKSKTIESGLNEKKEAPPTNVDDALAILQRDTFFEFRILRVNPLNFMKGSIKYDYPQTASYSFVASTDSPFFVLISLFILIHYMHLLFKTPTSTERKKYGRNRRVSQSFESNPASLTKDKLPASHIYVRDGEVDDDDDDLTCSEAGDYFDPIPLPRQVHPIVPPLLQHESIASTDGDDLDVIHSMHTNEAYNGNGGLPTYLKAPFSPNNHSINPADNIGSISNIPQSIQFPIDDSVTTTTASYHSLNYFICFVTEVTECTNDVSTSDIEREALLNKAHDEWLANMQKVGVILASGAYVGNTNNVSNNCPSKDGMMIIRARNFEHAQDIAMGDPYHQHCICTFRIMPWNVSNGQSSVFSCQRQASIKENPAIDEIPPGLNDSVHEGRDFDDLSNISEAKSTPEFYRCDFSLASSISMATSAPVPK